VSILYINTYHPISLLIIIPHLEQHRQGSRWLLRLLWCR
jgi:hypothetical protein